MNWQDVQDAFSQERAGLWNGLQAILIDSSHRGQFMEGMRRYRQDEEARLLQQARAKKRSYESLFVGLTALADVCLETVYLYETQEQSKKYGEPSSHFHMVGMGKFGGCEITIGSDLDMIFIFDRHGQTAGPSQLTNQEYFVRLVQRMISNLSLLTRSGRTYEVDTQLRPSGQAGVLVSSWEAFQEYHGREARIWEKQSLLRARPLADSPERLQDMQERIESQIWCRSYDHEMAPKIHELRLKMERELAKEEGDSYNIKVGPGGIIDIEFLTQYQQLRFGLKHQTIRVPHTPSALRALRAEGLLEEPQAERLESAYAFYRQLETCLRLVKQRAGYKLPRQEGEIAAGLTAAMELGDFKEVLEKYETYRVDVRQIYQQVLGV